jgi:MOSC domain-containing protein YiiM
MVAHKSVVVRQDAGIEGDRYFDAANRRGPDYQLSLIELENIEAFNAAYGLKFPPDAPRRNVVTTGIRLNDLCGQRFRIGSVVLEGLELCEPCRLFQVRTDPRALEFFMGKGGLRTRVLTGGVLEVGGSIDTVV